jgi:hypothetical protein
MNFSTICNKMFDFCKTDVAKTLIWTAAAGWVLSSLAQIFVVATDKKISKKDKKFLIPQEILDGITNVGLFLTITQLIKNAGAKLIDKGVLFRDDIAAAVEKLGGKKPVFGETVKGHLNTITSNSITDSAKKPVETLLSNYKETAAFRGMTPQAQQQIIPEMENALKQFGNFKVGVGVILTVLAGAVASSIITPFVRNKLGGVYQQQYLKKHGKDEVKKPETQTQSNPVPKFPAWSPVPANLKLPGNAGPASSTYPAPGSLYNGNTVQTNPVYARPVPTVFYPFVSYGSLKI